MDIRSCVYQNFLDGKVTKFSLVWSSVKKAQQAGEDCIARAYPCYSVMINLKNSKSHEVMQVHTRLTTTNVVPGWRETV